MGTTLLRIDNSFTTRSNRPGRDAQRSKKAIGARFGYLGLSGVTMKVSRLTTPFDLHYSFDDDWAAIPFGSKPSDIVLTTMRRHFCGADVRTQEVRFTSNR